MLAVSFIDWLGVGVAKQRKTWTAKLLHRCAHDSAECLQACAAGQASPCPEPGSRFRHRTPPTQRRCSRQSGSPYHSAASAAGRVAARRAERKLSPHVHPSQCRREQQTQTAARTKRVRPCDAERRLARKRANCRTDIFATSRIFGTLHQGVRCRSHLTRHKISCREPAVHATQHTLSTADTPSINRRLARGQLHRLG